MDRSVDWLRVGVVLMGLAWLPVGLAFVAPGDASIRYWLFVTAHGLNLGGFALAALADANGCRRFSASRLVLACIVEMVLAIIGPVAMGAASATMDA